MKAPDETRPQSASRTGWLLTAVVVCTAVCGVVAVHAQPPAAKAGGAIRPGGKKINPLEVKRLDAQLDEVRESFLRDTTKLILSYENLGQFERAKTLLEALQKLDPRNEPIRTKLRELNEKILEDGEFDLEIDPNDSWRPVGSVAKDQPLRIRVTGDYKLSASLALGPDGAPSAASDDLVPQVPFGAVMAVIIPSATAGGGQSDKPPRPFAVGGSYERPADRDGVLSIKVNLPPGTKCTGKLAARVSGPGRATP